MVAPRNLAWFFMAALLCSLTATSAFAQVDGENIPDEHAGWLVASQQNATGFGDNRVISVAGVTSGNEMDALYVTHDANDIWIGITGNLPNAAGAGQTIVLLIDADSSDDCNNFPTGCNFFGPEDEGCCMGDGTCLVMDPALCVDIGGTRLGVSGGNPVLCAGVDVNPPNGVDDACEAPIPPAAPNRIPVIVSGANALTGFGSGFSSVFNLGNMFDMGDPPAAIPDTGTILEPGFYPEIAIAINRFGSDTYVDAWNLALSTWLCLEDPPPPDCPQSFEPTLVGPDPANGHFISVYMDTTNGDVDANGFGDAGVTEDEASPADGAGQEAAAATAIKGLRVRISRSFLNAFQPEMKLMAILMAPDGAVSNQILPTLSEADDPPSPCSLHHPTDAFDDGMGGFLCPANDRADFESQIGIQMAEIDLTGPDATPTNPTQIHEDIPGNFPAGSLRSTQRIHTSFGNAGPGSIVFNQNGSELDQLFARLEDQYLDVAISGNLEQNGNKLYLFVDADPNVGESTLDSNGDPDNGFNPLRTWEGRTFDTGFAPEHAYVVNNNGGTLFVDHYSLLVPSGDMGQFPGTKQYLGFVGVNSGSGVLDDSAADADNSNNDEFALNNTNNEGVLAIDDESGLLGDPATANEGLEARISLFEIGVLAAPMDVLDDCPDIKIWAVLSGGDGGGRSFLSNQALPPYADVFTDLDRHVGSDDDPAGSMGGTPFDFSAPDDMALGGGEPAFEMVDLVADLTVTPAITKLGNVDESPDCCVTTDDIDEFVAALLDPDASARASFLADVNEDGNTDGLDVQNMTERILNEGPCP